jgi:hypothetical protein
MLLNDSLFRKALSSPGDVRGCSRVLPHHHEVLVPDLLRKSLDEVAVFVEN